MAQQPGRAEGDERANVDTLRGAHWRVVSRLLSRERRSVLEAAVRDGRLREVARLALLAPDKLERLALPSLWLLLGSGAGFFGLNLLARITHPNGPLLGTNPVWIKGAILIGANVASYGAMLPLHEGAHALVILALGGRPRFGLKLPFAAYCTAPDQLFTRNGYAAIALAPLVALTAAGLALTWLAPDIGACVFLLLAGNISGAVGDLVAVASLRRMPKTALILDTEDGFLAMMPESEAAGY